MPILMAEFEGKKNNTIKLLITLLVFKLIGKQFWSHGIPSVYIPSCQCGHSVRQIRPYMTKYTAKSFT